MKIVNSFYVAVLGVIVKKPLLVSYKTFSWIMLGRECHPRDESFLEVFMARICTWKTFWKALNFYLLSYTRDTVNCQFRKAYGSGDIWWGCGKFGGLIEGKTHLWRVVRSSNGISNKRRTKKLFQMRTEETSENVPNSEIMDIFFYFGIRYKDLWGKNPPDKGVKSHIWNFFKDNSILSHFKKILKRRQK